MILNGIEPPEQYGMLGEQFEDGHASPAWKRALELSAERRRN